MQNQKNNKPIPKEFEDVDMDVVAMILDDENADNVILFDENDNAVEFAQEGTIKYKGKLFAILSPLMEGVDEDEAVVFEINEKENTIEVVEDEKLFDEVLDIFNKEFVEGQE